MKWVLELLLVVITTKLNSNIKEAKVQKITVQTLLRLSCWGCNSPMRKHLWPPWSQHWGYSHQWCGVKEVALASTTTIVIAIPDQTYAFSSCNYSIFKSCFLSWIDFVTCRFLFLFATITALFAPNDTCPFCRYKHGMVCMLFGSSIFHTISMFVFLLIGQVPSLGSILCSGSWSDHLIKVWSVFNMLHRSQFFLYSSMRHL